MRLPGALAVVLVALTAPAGCFRHDPPAPDWSQCAVNSDCVLAADSCCGVCGAPTVDDVDGVNRTHTDEHFQDVCPAPTPCPGCPSAENPDLLATCATAACQAVDIRQHPASACVADTDCRLRTTGCCECGGNTDPSALIAIAWAGEPLYAGLVCDPAAACPECAPTYPPEVEAFCAADGHCDLREVGCANCASMGLTCCDGHCVATYNDVFNCGACGVTCTDPNPYCDGTGCTTPPCTGGACPPAGFCCGDTCCADGQLCCTIPGPGPLRPATCVDPDATGTCPVGCPLCR